MQRVFNDSSQEMYPSGWWKLYCRRSRPDIRWPLITAVWEELLLSNDQVLRRALWSTCRGWGMTRSDRWSILTTWRSTKKILFFRWLTLFNHEYNEVNFGFSQRLFKSAGIDQNHLGPGAMDFAVKFAQVLILSGPKSRLGQCWTWFKFRTWALRSRSCTNSTRL